MLKSFRQNIDFNRQKLASKNCLLLLFDTYINIRKFCRIIALRRCCACNFLISFFSYALSIAPITAISTNDKNMKKIQTKTNRSSAFLKIKNYFLILKTFTLKNFIIYFLGQERSQGCKWYPYMEIIGPHFGKEVKEVNGNKSFEQVINTSEIIVPFKFYLFNIRYI